MHLVNVEMNKNMQLVIEITHATNYVIIISQVPNTG